MPARLALALVVAAACALGALLLVRAEIEHRIAEQQAFTASAPGDPSATRFAGSVMPPGVRAPDFSLRDQDGRVVSMRALRGRPVIVTFTYTHCRDACPAQVQQVKGALDDLGGGARALAVAVDPPNDTPASANAFLREQGMIGRMSFVLGTRAELRPVWKGFAVQPQTRAQEHQARIALIDKRGVQRVGFTAADATPEAIAHDVRVLEQE